ncbi:MAG: hypothetical protein U9N87_10025 [Planctomycetota bacterium]|nr:hypothetical protein [Planctomycetota bacterium]
MKILDKLQRRFGRFAIHNLTLVIIAGQVFFYLLNYSNREILGGGDGFAFGKIDLVPALVLQGQAWRLVTFIFTPPLTHPIFMFFAWYIFFLMGTALEGTWGAFRYNLFLLVGYLATVAAAFTAPAAAATTVFIGGSVFLAFAYMFPDFKLHLFFVLPIRIKWLAMLTWVSYLFVVFSGDLHQIGLLAASLVNYFLFFGRDIVLRMRSGHRKMRSQSKRIAQQNTPRHCCRICGITNLTHADMDFRYCSQCADTSCYCEEHLRNHEHVQEDN